MSIRNSRVPLHYAALVGDIEQIAAILAAGADPSEPDASGFTPLHLAAQEWRVDAVRVLLRAGAAVDSMNEFGNTPLFVAVFNSRGRGEVISLLRRSGADPLARNRSGQTPLGLARLIANFDVEQYFADVREVKTP